MFLVFLFLLGVGAQEEKNGKSLSVFNVVKFPNTGCGSTSNLNGTCYTASECTSLGGTASGSCASSFGVCCVFSLACGASSSANTTYAIRDPYSTTTDTDPCIYTFCKNNDDICKLRIDFETMVISDPDTVTAGNLPGAVADSASVGDCNTDSLTVNVPGFASPPVICGYNTGQHMFVPASDSCVKINLDIDTSTTATTRQWQIKVTQYECGDLNAPDENCLQYHTAITGTVASFNWDTSTTTALTATTAANNAHLSDQYYSICIRRARGYCSVCYSPQTTGDGATNGIASSFGLSANYLAIAAAAPAAIAAIDTQCGRITSVSTAAVINAANIGYGDYLDIPNLQAAIGTAGTLGTNRICGTVFAATGIAQATLCSFETPFRIGVHFDADETIFANTAGATNAWANIENEVTEATDGAGIAYTGFWLAYWQNTCSSK